MRNREQVGLEVTVECREFVMCSLFVTFGHLASKLALMPLLSQCVADILSQN